MKRIAILALLLFLVACHAPPRAPSPDQAEGRCGAVGYQHLVGSPASTIDQTSLPAGTRVLYPDSIMTRDYRLDRMNVYINATGTVDRVDCG